MRHHLRNFMLFLTKSLIYEKHNWFYFDRSNIGLNSI